MSTATSKTPAQIGRFAIQRALGAGAEGTVYLATDTRLGRPVALKTLARRDPATVAANLDEARIIGRLSHPHIVTLYDAGEDGALRYLVFEYVEGRTLAALIREHGRLEVGRAVEIAIALAQGVAYAHEHGIVHRDLKPANVMITPEGVARLMDFGIAQRGAAAAADPAALVGTPAYMAPEYIRERRYPPASDVYALGVVLYEMLTGTTPAAGGAAREVLRRTLEDEFAPPSRHNSVIDEHLDNLVMKALAKNPAERYAGAAELAGALRSYLDPEGESTPASQGTLEYLLRRIRHKGDFPALSATITAVNRAVSSDREPVSVLCASILRDVALTSRLLKIVNASALGQFGGSISTVSRAISILGFDAVRNVSMSLILFEHMHSRTNAAALKDQVVAIYFSGLLARELHGHADLRDAEQAFVCAMFHRLGKLLATFYLQDEAQMIERTRQTRGWDEARAARDVLGISYEELGVGVGKAWNFPAEIIDSMRTVSGAVGRCPSQHNEKLRLVASMANELADVVQSADAATRSRQLAALAARYSEATGITEKALTAAVRSSADTMMRDADTLGAGVARNGFLREARGWREPARTAAAAAAGATGDETVQQVAQTQLLLPDAALDEQAAGAPADTTRLPEPGRRQAALAAGVQEITNTLVGDHSLNDILRIILETMYRAIGFHRVLLFVADARQQALRCRFGFGPDVESIVQRGVAVPLAGARDLFYAAAVLGNDLCIEDMQGEKVRSHVPDWYRKSIGARGMVLLPIVNRKRTLGLIYADSESPEILRFSAEELGLLRTLRNQALLAMRQA